MNETVGRMMGKKAFWAALSLGALVIGLVFWKSCGRERPTFKEVSVSRGDLRVVITATGTVAPENRLEIKPPIAGRVEDVKVKEGEAVKKGQVLAWMSSSERAALLDAAQARGPGELKRWREFYRPTPILAPIDGTVILRNVEPGQSFTTQDPILVLSDRLTVKAQVDETDIGNVRLEQNALLSLDAYPKQSFSGHVDQIAFDATTVSNVTTYVVDVLPENPPDFLRSGMTASVNFEIASRTDVLRLPTEAARRGPGADAGATVLVRGENGKPFPREITLGIDDGQYVEIVSGLREDDVVLIPQKKPKSAAKTNNPFSPVRPGGQGQRGGSRRGS